MSQLRQFILSYGWIAPLPKENSNKTLIGNISAGVRENNLLKFKSSFLYPEMMATWSINDKHLLNGKDLYISERPLEEGEKAGGALVSGCLSGIEQQLNS